MSRENNPTLREVLRVIILFVAMGLAGMALIALGIWTGWIR